FFNRGTRWAPCAPWCDLLVQVGQSGEGGEAEGFDGAGAAPVSQAGRARRRPAAEEANGETGQEAVAGAGGIDFTCRERGDVLLPGRGKDRASARAVREQDRARAAEDREVQGLGLRAARLQVVDTLQRREQSRRGRALHHAPGRLKRA